MKDLKYYINKALKKKFALGAFNFSNLESLQAITFACKECNSPAIIAVSESALKYMGEKEVIALSQCAKSKHSPLFLHLDHGKSFEICKRAVDLGFDSVMIDGSSLSFSENIQLTKKVVNYAHKKGVLVEGELGQLKGIEDEVTSDSHFYTDSNQAKNFVEETGVDMLAIAIGTSHGAYKHNGSITLRIDILEKIEKLLPNFPLVLHGASTINKHLINKINNNGGNITNAQGIPESLLKSCVKEHNIVKINTDTDLRLAMTAQVRSLLYNDEKVFDPRSYLSKGRDCMQEEVYYKINNILLSNDQK